MTHDIVVDTLFEENLLGALQTIGDGAARMVMDREDPEEPYLTPEDNYLIIRVKDRDPYAFARELQRRAFELRVITIVERKPGAVPESAPAPGSYRAQRESGII